MCGILGIVGQHGSHVNQLLYDGLTVLQHRGQDAAGILTDTEGHSDTSAAMSLGIGRLPRE